MKKADTAKRTQGKHERKNYPSDRERYAGRDKLRLLKPKHAQSIFTC